MPAVSRWSAESLHAARQVGDPPVDLIAQRILTSPSGRRDWTQMLAIADRLTGHPELALARGTHLAQAMDEIPGEYLDYFDPCPAPDWVDPEQLRIASEVWEANQVAIIGVLYGASLPSCYLIKHGIPALYDSGKLGQHKYIYQRIYETGLMLDAVMESGGLQVLDDQPLPFLPRGALAMNDWSAADPHDVDHASQSGTVARRWLWGGGLIAARKVRLLHAGMRQMLLGQAAGGFGRHSGFNKASWNTAERGVPVNQADLVYTLLTFGLLIPRGLERWGCILSSKEREAFIHTWRVIGYLMGIEAKLLPTSWAESEALFDLILSDPIVVGESEMGKRLTRTLEQFLRDYLPQSLRKDLPRLIIVDLIGPTHAAMILPDGLPGSSIVSFGYRVAMTGLRWYYWAKYWFIHLVPVVGPAFRRSVSKAGDALMASWRDGYVRRPFDLPEGAAGPWLQERGYTLEYKHALHAWRQALMGAVCLGVAGLVVGVLMLVLAAGLIVLFPPAVPVIGLIGGIAILLGMHQLGVRVGALADRRPKPVAALRDASPSAPR